MDVDTWRLRAQTAMHEQGTLLEIARIILAFSSEIDDLTREICREVVERHKYDHFAIYLARGDGDAPKLAAGDRLGPDLPQQNADALAGECVAHSQYMIVGDGDFWRVAVPIEDGSTTLGAMLAASSGSQADAHSALVLCRALSRLVAIGIQNANLRVATAESKAQ